MQRRNSPPFITEVKACGEQRENRRRRGRHGFGTQQSTGGGQTIYRPGWRLGKEEEEDKDEEENLDFSSHHTGIPPWSMLMQQSTRAGVAINKQSTRLGMDEEEKKKFAFFFSSFEAAFIAAGMEVKMAVSGDM